jgi:ketosteroid isomerase-like protein
MPSFLSDPSTGLYLVLLAIVVITGAVAARHQDRPTLIRFAIALAILLALYGIDRAVESPREEAVRRVQAMAAAADAKNPDQFVEQMADTVEYRGGDKPVLLKKTEIRNSPFWDTLRQQSVRVTVWDFSRDDVKTSGDDTIEIGFHAKGEMREGMVPLYMRATFRKQPDGQWKLAAFGSYRFEKHEEVFAIPGLSR